MKQRSIPRGLASAHVSLSGRVPLLPRGLPRGDLYSESSFSFGGKKTTKDCTRLSILSVLDEEELMQKRGCGVLFYDETKKRVLFFRRDNTLAIKFPDYIDILGGNVESNETPQEAIVREMGEELDDLRSGRPFKLANHRLFKVYVDEWGTEQHIFYRKVDFDVSDVRLNEGQYLVWLNEKEAREISFAFGFVGVVREFFQAMTKERF